MDTGILYVLTARGEVRDIAKRSRCNAISSLVLALHWLRESMCVKQEERETSGCLGKPGDARFIGSHPRLASEQQRAASLAQPRGPSSLARSQKDSLLCSRYSSSMSRDLVVA